MKNGSTKDLLKSLEGMYTNGEFKQSIDLLLKNKDQFEAGLFHYNLGTLYAKAGNNAAGRFHLEKAISEGFVNTQVLNNLQGVKSRLQVRDISSSSSYMDRAMDMALTVPSSLYLCMTLVCLFASLLLIKKKILKSRLSIVLALILSIVPVAVSELYLSGINYAVALNDARMYDGPSKIYFEKGLLQAGSKVIVGKNTNGWFLIKHPLNLSGWVKSKDLGFY